MIGRTIIIGGVYRHFRGSLYRVEALALHSENREELVIYRSTKEGIVWARPKDMFLSEVDREKYPDVAQQYRFEYISG